MNSRPNDQKQRHAGHRVSPARQIAVIATDPLTTSAASAALSLSPRERAGVRGKGAINPPSRKCSKFPIPHSALRTPHSIRAFTLIELLVVIAIIALLAG